MIFFWVILIIIVVWYLAKESNKTAPSSTVHEEKVEKVSFTEEAVFAIQTKFEKHLEETYLPDAISGKEIYIYHSLVRPWYNELASKNRYDESISKNSDLISSTTWIHSRTGAHITISP